MEQGCEGGIFMRCNHHPKRDLAGIILLALGVLLLFSLILPNGFLRGLLGCVLVVIGFLLCRRC